MIMTISRPSFVRWLTLRSLLRSVCHVACSPNSYNNKRTTNDVTMLSEAVQIVVIWLLLSGISAIPLLDTRGGATRKASDKGDSDAYRLLAVALESRFQDVDVESLGIALKSLSSAQQALKGLDGAAHEAYQRTHSDDSELTSVSGRARRSAARAASTADAFLAAELCELAEMDDLDAQKNKNGTLAHREIVMHNVQVKLNKKTNVTLLVLWEPSYRGGAGMNHGGLDDLTGELGKKRGRLLVIIRDPLKNNLKATIETLDEEPIQVELHSGLVANEIASVHANLYRCAGRVLREMELLLLKEKFNQSDIAFHFVGQSLAGGVASLSAIILDGSLSLPREGKKKTRNSAKRLSNKTIVDLAGFGRGRSSAVVLGAPPCISGNVKASFVKSIIYGDDIVCRTTHESLQNLCERTKRALKGGILGRRIGWMSDVVSLTVSSMKSHARGSEGEEERLVVPGQSFLIRPRRFASSCSMHEVGGLKGGREALRATVLWQLHDVLLSKSLLKHHELQSYIHGLDKVHLRGVVPDSSK